MVTFRLSVDGRRIEFNFGLGLPRGVTASTVNGKSFTFPSQGGKSQKLTAEEEAAASEQALLEVREAYPQFQQKMAELRSSLYRAGYCVFEMPDGSSCGEPTSPSTPGAPRPQALLCKRQHETIGPMF